MKIIKKIIVNLVYKVISDPAIQTKNISAGSRTPKPVRRPAELNYSPAVFIMGLICSPNLIDHSCSSNLRSQTPCKSLFKKNNFKTISPYPPFLFVYSKTITHTQQGKRLPLIMLCSTHNTNWFKM